jgi:cytochrome c-type biogenesis protein CcmH
VLALLLIQVAFAESIEAKDFETLDQENRYTVLIGDIRCPVCQGQSIGGSNSDLASDLREQVREMILNKRSDKDIYLFMVERYGDFVIFKPPINIKTYLLWFAPLLLLFLCLIYLFRVTRNKKQNIVSSTIKIQRAKKLLK